MTQTMAQRIKPPRQPQRVGIYVMPNFSPFHISVPFISFGKAMPNEKFYSPFMFSDHVGTVHSYDGFNVDVTYDLDHLDPVDIIIIPYWPDQDSPVPTKLVTVLQELSKQNKIIMGLCLGSYVLAQAGLLDGKKATTHWAYEKEFALKFPKIKLDNNALYVEDKNIITSAGTAAGIDCCLYLIRKTYGGAVANSVARMIVTPPHREGGQAQYISTPVPSSTADHRINALLETIRKTINKPYSLDMMASTVGMSRRTFTRRFQFATGLSPMEWLTIERLHYSQELLETRQLSIEQIAIDSGFTSATSFRRCFLTHFKVTPSDWRKTFSYHIGPM